VVVPTGKTNHNESCEQYIVDQVFKWDAYYYVSVSDVFCLK